MEAILKTLAYADIFDYPLTKKEIIKWLISDKRSVLSGLVGSELSATCSKAKGSSEPLIGKTSNYYHLPNRSHLAKIRKSRHHFSQLKLTKAKKISKILSAIPSVKLIAVTGALAMNNSDKNDDIDLMIVTTTNRLWLTRLLVIPLLEIFHLRRRPQKRSVLEGTPLRPDLKGLESVLGPENAICLNLFLEESSISIPKSRRNLYTAHEVCQIKPLYNKDQTYEKFISTNSWVKKFLPNALPKNALQEQFLTEDKTTKPRWFGTSASNLATPVNTGASSEPSVLNYLNLLAFKLQYAYMKKKITNEKVTLHSAFFHPRPTGKIVIKEYKAKLRTVLKGVGFRTSSSDLIGTTSTNVEASSEPSMSTKILITGCFDVLHEEHKKFLKAAKKFKVPNLKFSPQSHHLRGEVAPAVHLGGVSPNILLVGLETDVRVKKLKGKNRPINPINTRIKNLKKWGIADQIFSLPEKFDNPTDHLKLLKKIRPDILAVSAHTPNLPAKRKLMKQIGGSVIVVHPHNPKLSTTKILKYKVRHYSEKELQKFIRNDKII